MKYLNNKKKQFNLYDGIIKTFKKQWLIYNINVCICIYILKQL